MATDAEAAVAVAAPRPKNPNKVRKRAPKACLSCRARKVRCDVSQRGRPCMNCYLDSETCVVTGRASRLRKSQRPATEAGALVNGASSAATDAVGGQPPFPSDGGFGAGDGHNHDAIASAAAAAAALHVHADGQPQHQHAQHTHDHEHGHAHPHSHPHSHSHPHAHQHGSPQSDASSRHRTASIKGSPTARDSEPPQQQHSNEAPHNSPPVASVADDMDDMDGLPRTHSDHQGRNHHQQPQQQHHHHHHQPQQQHQQQTNHHHHNQYSQSRFSSSSGLHDDPPSQSTGFRNSGGSAPWAAEQGLSMSADITYSYYPFLAISNLSGILPQDVNYLELQGCLRVPTRSILDEFVQQYFLHVHPLLPLFNEGDFWELYCQQPDGGGGAPPAGRMSLLVFQAVLFATCNFVSRNSIRALGFPTIRLARAALYRRAKLLFDFETESSPAAIAQAALLLSFWSPSTNPGTKNPNTAWLCTAIQQAKLAEAHHYAGLPRGSGRRANALKRLWWCCIIRDRVMGLGVRRSIQITRAHFDLEANPPLSRADLADEIERSRVYNPGTKSCLIEILVHMVELCVVLTDILTLVFPQDDTPGWGRQMADGDAGRVRQCKIELRRWYKDVALKFPMFGGAASSPGSSSNANKSGDGGGVARLAGGAREFYHDSVILYTNLMYMYYHSSRVALCHHEVLHIAVANAAPGLGGTLANGGGKAVPVIYENRYELQDAASGVTECLKELIQLRLARWLPISAVACTALPLFLHILDVKLSTSASSANNAANNNTNANANSANTPSDGSGGSDASTSASSALKQHRLNILIEAMKTYQPQYDGVDWVSETIRHIVNLAQLDGPSGAQANGSSGNNNNGVISDWTDILASNPSWYLRLALTMDLALSKNRMPEERDFPVGLRGLFTGGFSPIRGLRLGYNRDGSVPANSANGSGNSINNANSNANSNNQYASSNGGHSANVANVFDLAHVAAAAAPGMTATVSSPPSNLTLNGSVTVNGVHNDSNNNSANNSANTYAAPPPAKTPGIVNMMSEPAAAAAAAAAAVAAAGGPLVDFANGGGGADYSSAAFMLAPHHLAMSMGMAMGMDMGMDMDLDMDMSMSNMGMGNMGMNMSMAMAAFPPPPLVAAPPGGVVTQLPSSSGEESPASGASDNSPPSHQDAQLRQQHDAMLDAYTFGSAADGSPGTTATDVDDLGDGHHHGSGGGGGDKKVEGDEWIEPAWDDEGPELREGDRDTARALLEAMGESA